MSPTIGPVLVIGTGLIGTSIALSLAEAGVETLLADVDARHRDEAVAMSAGRALQDGDDPRVVVVAVPPRFAAQALADASGRFPFATLTDVTSVKEHVLDEAVRLGADERRLVGGHPMAGREVSGPGAARADLVHDRWWILTPTGSTDDERLQHVHRLVMACGAYAIQMSPEAHDRAVALVSHAPQLLSSTLAAQLVEARDDEVRVAGSGLRDMTRIAASDSALWTDILSVNAGPVADVLEGIILDLQEQLQALRATASRDADAVRRITEELVAGASGQARIPGKHGAAAARYEVVEVVVADRPGEMARLFVAVGDVGVNIEDVRMEHVLGRPSGMIELSVRPDAAERLRDALRERGFDVRR